MLFALFINAGTAGGHQTHFHITLQTPELKALPQNLLAKETIIDETQGITSKDLDIAAQALLDTIKPQINYEQGDVTMFAMDMPPDVPAQYTSVVIAMASKSQSIAGKTDHTIGVCHLIENPPSPSWSAVNSISPIGSVYGYLKERNLLKPEQLTEEIYKGAKLSVLQEPKYGNLKIYESTQSARYFSSTPEYKGIDNATFLVEYAGIKVKVLYFFKVMPFVPGGTDGYDPYEDKKYCPKGGTWKISLYKK